MKQSFNKKVINDRIKQIDTFLLLYPLQYISGQICDCNGNTIALMNRESGTTPLAPSERDDLAKEFVNLFNSAMKEQHTNYNFIKNN